jgi:carboxyl-terminal processing protease
MPNTRKLMFLLAAGSCAIFATAAPATAADEKLRYQYLNALGDALEKVREVHVDEPDDRKLIEGAIKGMLEALGTHSSYFTAEELNAQTTANQGEFGGIGVQVQKKDQFFEVVAPIDGTPADRAGLRSGDLITQVDGKGLSGLSLSQAVDLMRGKIGSRITLTVVRGGVGAPEQIDLTRAKIALTGIQSRAEGKAGYIRISGFTEKSVAEFRKAIETLRGSIGGGLEGYIIDLRNTPGGLLIPATEIADALLDGGTIVTTRGRVASINKTYAAKPGDITMGKRIVVLVNGGTASGAEVLAGALKDNGRATLVGSRTFGNGTVAEFIRVKNFGAMKVTNGRFHTPSGRPIEALGLMPDVELNQAAPGAPAGGAQGALRYAYVPKDKADDAQLKKAIEVLAGKDPPPAAGSGTGGLTPDQLRKLD